MPWIGLDERLELALIEIGRKTDLISDLAYIMTVDSCPEALCRNLLETEQTHANKKGAPDFPSTQDASTLKDFVAMLRLG
jgi:hypothetical protein